MKKKLIVMLMALCTAVLGIVGVLGYIKKDRVPPTIHYTNDNIEYRQGDTYETILKYITAVDERDGEIKVNVENIYPLYGTDTAKVFVFAYDSSGNVTKDSIIVTYYYSSDSENTRSWLTDKENQSDYETEVQKVANTAFTVALGAFQEHITPSNYFFKSDESGSGNFDSTT